MDLLNTFLNTLFVELLNRSISVSWLIVAVIVLRLALKRAPKWVACLLWAMVAVRLVCPVNIPSPVSVYNLMETKTAQTGSVAYFYYNDSLEKPEVSIDFPAIPGYPDNQEMPSSEGAGIHTSRVYLPPMRAFWLTGLACMAAYGLTSYLKLRRKVRVSLKVGEHCWICDEISSPFILGVVRPRIYLPSDLSGEELEYVMAHEQAHLRRRDHWWKLLGYLLLTVYWFHPLVWAAYALFCRDIELACDEKVCKGMDAASRKAYATTLLHCNISERSVAICPLSFSEVGVKERVKAVLNYKKPAFWVVTAAVLICGIVAVCFLTEPKVSDVMDNKSEQQLVQDTPQNERTDVREELQDTFGSSSEITESSYETQAQELIQKAFSYDVSGIEPEIDVFNDGDRTSLTYVIDSDEESYLRKHFIVDFSDALSHPMMLYYFCHIGEDSEFDLAQESSDYFQEDMVQVAKDFVKKMYDVDCSGAEVHAYGYKNKICVELKVASDQFYHVRFYYNDIEPVGVLFDDNFEDLNETMELNQAKKYF